MTVPGARLSPPFSELGNFNHIIFGWRPVSDWVPLEVTIPGPNVTEYDYFYDYEEFSPRLTDLFMAYGGEFFERLPLTVNGSPYFCLASIERLDCIDREKSVMRVSESDPSKILYMKHPVFKTRQIPEKAVFRVAGLAGYIFLTEPVVREAEAMKLKGIVFRKVYSDE